MYMHMHVYLFMCTVLAYDRVSVLACDRVYAFTAPRHMMCATGGARHQASHARS